MRALIPALACAAVLLLGTPAPAAPRGVPTPTPSPTPAVLPIGGVDVRVTAPGQQPSGASHVESPRFR